MATHKKFYLFDPTLVAYIGTSTGTKSVTGIPYGSRFYESDTQIEYMFGSTGGWVKWWTHST